MTAGQVVVHAQIVDRLGLCQQRSVVVHPGPWPQRVEERTRSFQLRPTSFRHRQPSSRLNLEHDHGRPVGRLVALEQGADNGLWGTWIADELALLQGVTPWYVSAEATWKGDDADAHDIELEGAALVRSPGATCTQPALVLAGRLGNQRDRQRWQLNGAVRDRVERAAEQLRYRRPDDPVTIHDHTPERERQLRSYQHLDPAAKYQVLQEEAWRIQSPQRQHGPIRHSEHHGKILRVR